MKYQNPYGTTGTNIPYINGNPATGVEGSIPPAAAIQYPMTEIVNVITNAGLTPSDSDLQQLWEAILAMIAGYAVRKVPATTFYVNGSTGNDTNNGLTPSTAFATIAGAESYIAQFQSFVPVTINVAAGTYTIASNNAAFYIVNSLISSWNIVGAGSGTTIIDATATNSAGFQTYGDQVKVSNFTVLSNKPFSSQSGGRLILSNIAVASMTTGDAFAASNGGLILLSGPIALAGTAASDFSAELGGTIMIGWADRSTPAAVDITFASHTVTQTAFAGMSGTILLYPSVVTWHGTPTGHAYNCQTAGGIQANGNTIPGSLSGNVTSPGWYAA